MDDTPINTVVDDINRLVMTSGLFGTARQNKEQVKELQQTIEE